MLNSSYYAYVQTEDGWITSIQEKQPYTDTPMNEWASSGTYYFKSGKMVRDYFTRTLSRKDLVIVGEHYVSVVYTPMLEDGATVAVYELNHFMQWGAPLDFQEYQYWSDAFRGMCDPQRGQPQQPRAGTALVPMAGLGSRYAREGYELPKPLIPVSGEPMVVQAARDLPALEQHVFVQRRDLPGHEKIATTLRERFPGCRLVEIDHVTDGQARSSVLGLDGVDLEQPLTIGACDNGALFDADAFNRLMDDPDVDVIVWVARGYPGAVRHPQQHGWVEESEGRVLSVTGKKPLADPAHDPSLIGCFTFKRAGDFLAAADAMFARDARVNGEFYVDVCINDAIALGLRCHVFEVANYLCWGTPDDLRTFEYWQSCLHKWASHPYRLEKDARIPAAALPVLAQRYRLRRPERPATLTAEIGVDS
jgi:CTP:molybdopterin cytidylyltransferase MocA